MRSGALILRKFLFHLALKLLVAIAMAAVWILHAARLGRAEMAQACVQFGCLNRGFNHIQLVSAAGEQDCVRCINGLLGMV